MELLASTYLESKPPPCLRKQREDKSGDPLGRKGMGDRTGWETALVMWAVSVLTCALLLICDLECGRRGNTN